MSRKWIWILAGFMAIAMTGLIVVQAYWIKNAIEVKEKQFDQLVRQALGEVVYEVQRQETLNHVVSRFNPGFTSHPGYTDSSNTGYHYGLNFDTTFQFKPGQGTGYFDIQQNIVLQHGRYGNRMQANVTINGKDTIVFFDRSDQAGEYTAGLSTVPRNRLFGSAAGQNNSLQKDFVDDLLNRMFTVTPEIEKRVKPELLEEAIRKSLMARNINIGFEYAVTKWNLDVVFQSDKFNKDIRDGVYRVRLFPYDFYPSSNYLSVSFPARKNFFMHSLGFMGFSSVLLTLIIIFAFSLTIIIIFRQKKLSEMKSDFVNNMTHELKTPISTISLASQMLSDRSIPEKSKNFEYISSVISKESKRLGYQVEKVLQMAIFDRGKINFKFRNVDVHEIIEGVINNFSIQIRNKNGLIIPSLHAVNPVARVDVVHFTNMLSNLVDNAIKYSREELEIFIETQNKQERLYILIRDNGIGITKENQHRIFEKFYRVSTGNVHNVKGFGLGLSYVKKIVEEHNGNISIESELNNGTTFEICLPQ